MKQFIFSALAFLACVSCAPKHDGYTVKGKLIGMDNVKILLRQNSVGRGKERVFNAIDSAIVKDGEFTFQGKIEDPDMYDLLIDGKYTGRMFIENTEIEANVDASKLSDRDWVAEVQSKGSKMQADYDAVEAKANAAFKDPKYKPIEKVHELFGIAKKSGKQEDMDKALALQKELYPLMEERLKAFNKIKFDYVDANPTSPVSVYVMGYQYSEGRMSPDELKKYYKHFTGAATKTNFYKGYITKVYKDNFVNMAIGSTVPNFTLKTPKGEEIDLSTVEGKYILIDFWASWCVPCRASFPGLMKLYKEYHKDGFEILGVGTCDTQDKWLKAVKEDNTPWLHVFDINPEGRDYGPVAKQYGVPFLPTTFLVDANKKIILRNASKEELAAKLKELFGK